ncbi:dipeptide epimerase [Roseinatronobacter alkalisoli]|uniref:Dipeptide epimerase n=1 Tax=Roseinatronobacter alkalisoli TaxID=3028235 RepID=A0ABT5TGL0_9RHOB|nr:dipeptide epimerase [Roseinatronobacter sp. HJB301]MDD7973068.1 dipeptide epimerase [Roseinatronobacter sp. HJB301]
MKVDFRAIYLKKRFPLRISRGEIPGGENLFVSVTEDGLTGWGEMAPGKTEGAATVAEGRAQLEGFCAKGLKGAIHDIWFSAHKAGVGACALAALDMALWDLRAKQAGMPLYHLLGLARRGVVSSLTVGINPPEVVRERVPLLLDRGARALKIKLGSNDGIEADKAMFAAVHEVAQGSGAALRVDANGGWSLTDARHMMGWLATRGVEYVEQPLVQGAEDQLPELFRDRALPIFVDESCRFSSDIPAFAHCVDGVNLKLMKCGGISEALRIVATARAHGLKTMIGCMGESSVSIAAGASLSALFDYIDLDSHLNLDPDPATGAPFVDGVTLPADQPGHGGTLHA